MSVKRYGQCFNMMVELREGDYVLHSDYTTLLTRHNALVEAVAWERELDETLVWLVQTGLYPRDMAGKYDLANERECARAEVDRLLQEEK